MPVDMKVGVPHPALRATLSRWERARKGGPKGRMRDLPLILIVVVSLCLLRTSTIAQPAALQAVANPVPEFVTTYCVSCHNDRLKTGMLTLENVDTRQVF